MRTVIDAWWRQLSTREQRLVGVMLVLLVVTVTWLGVVRPVEAALARAEARQARTLAAIARVRAAQAELAHLEARPASAIDEPLISYIRRLAAEDGIPLATLQAQSGNLAVLSVTAVRAPALLAWMQRLEVRQGLAIESFSANRNDDATIAAQMTLRRPAR